MKSPLVIDIAVLGTAAMMPLEQRWLSSLLIRLKDELMLFDVGEGVQIPWRNCGWGVKRVSMICISHWHADHIAGLPGVLHSLANAGREEPLTIIGPRGTRNIVSRLREVAPSLPFEVRTADLATGQSWIWNGMKISVVNGEHRVPVLIYRFDLPRNRSFRADLANMRGVPRTIWSRLAAGGDVPEGDPMWLAEDFLGPDRPGISFAVMTDTRPTIAAAQHLAGVNLLIAEGTYGDDGDLESALMHKHMTFREAAQFASTVSPGELLLTHFSQKMARPDDWLANATVLFPKTRLARQGMEITLNYPATDSGGGG